MRILFAVLALAAAAQSPKTGPAVGQRIPSFSLIDQHGNRQTFDSLKGRKGLILTFVRSADW